jgi:adenylate cyclase
MAAVESAFTTELEDDLADVRVAAHSIAESGATRRALESGDPTVARRSLEHVGASWPDFDLLLFGKDGALLSQLGCTSPREALSGLLEKARTETFQGVLEHGCESGTTRAPPAYVLAMPIEGGGVVVVCLPLDKASLVNAMSKLGVQLAFVENDGTMLEKTPRFPELPPGTAEKRLSVGGRTFALARFTPKVLVGGELKVAVLAALDVTDSRRLVLEHLLLALAVLLCAALVSAYAGWSIANEMGVALGRINTAMGRLEAQDYVHVEGVKTGDELEDLATGFNSMVEGLKERDKLRTTFGKYMTEAVVKHLMSGQVKLGGEQVEVTVLFTDIRSFTSISEKMDAPALVALLNEYFHEMVTIVMNEGGVVDKYIGDAIMAVFGAPVPSPDDAARAMRAAVKMRAALAALNERLAARGLPTLETGIGIHTGVVVAGNIGSERRMEYTVIGDTVNLASRLESATKDLGVKVLVSEDTWKRAGTGFVGHQVKEITVKGRQQPVMTWALTGVEAS